MFHNCCYWLTGQRGHLCYPEASITSTLLVTVGGHLACVLRIWNRVPLVLIKLRTVVKKVQWHILPGEGVRGEQRKVTGERTKRVCRGGRGAMRRAEGRREGDGDSGRLSFCSGGAVLWSPADLRFVRYPHNLPPDLPLLLKPEGVGFYHLQPAKPRLKQMRVYFQITGPKRCGQARSPHICEKCQEIYMLILRKLLYSLREDRAVKKGKSINRIEPVLNGMESDPMTYMQWYGEREGKRGREAIL